jgi:hypothetical protein
MYYGTVNITSCGSQSSGNVYQEATGQPDTSLMRFKGPSMQPDNGRDKDKLFLTRFRADATEISKIK